MRKFSVKVNGQPYEVEIEEIAAGVTVAPVVAPAPVVAAPAPVAAPVAAPKTNIAGVELKAPMPGTLVDFKVANGASVKKGQPVAILEAMKMENEIAANADGTVTLVATKGASVNTGDVLAVIA